jgi:hypothetical protein
MVSAPVELLTQGGAWLVLREYRKGVQKSPPLIVVDSIGSEHRRSSFATLFAHILTA